MTTHEIILQCRRMESTADLDTGALCDLYPELKFVFDQFDTLREDLDEAIRELNNKLYDV